jgi:hypothetical protein
VLLRLKTWGLPLMAVLTGLAQDGNGHAVHALAWADLRRANVRITRLR